MNYTYLIKSEYLDSKAITEVFAERGNWIEYEWNNTAGPTFFFKDGVYQTDPALYNINATITNIMDKNIKHSIYAKDSLYDIFMRYNKAACEKFMVEQYNVNNQNFKTITKKIFGDKIWILKAVMSSSGKDVHIMETYDDYLTFFQNKPKLNRWVLAEYIMDPLLIYDRKFHIRIYYLATGPKRKDYYQTNGFMITAAAPYIKGDYSNKKIHDTHRASSIPNLFFPQGLETYPDAEEKISYIRNQISELCYHISKMSNLKCYKGDPRCFEIFGMDIMVTTDFKIKLIEINEKNSWLTTYEFTKNYLQGIMETVVDPKFPPKNQIIKTNYFTPVMLQLHPIQTGATIYTYSIYADNSINDEYIEQIFHSRGNWKRVVNGPATFIYVYLKGYLPENKILWEYPADLKNVVVPSAVSITNKSNLYHLFTEYNTMIRDKYLVKQYDVDLYNYRDIISANEFTASNIWILKPVHSWGGMGISIYNNHFAFITDMDKKKKNLRHTAREKKSKLQWVLAQYIDKPLLFQKRKFHLRVPYLYYDKRGYIGKLSGIITAAQEYVQNDYSNKNIHDTHIKKSIQGLLFPRDFDSQFNEEIANTIFNSMKELFYHVTQIMNQQQIKCYADSKKCFEVYGADIMITDNYEIKLLEINNNAGFTGFIHKVIDGVVSTIVDPMFPPQRAIEKSDFFVDITEFNVQQSRIKPTNNYHAKYLKYKKKYLQLKQFAGNNTTPYPLYRDNYDLTAEKFRTLVAQFKPKILHEIPQRMVKKYHHLQKYNNNYTLIEENWKANEELNSVTDYFTEECRIGCTFGAHNSPLNFWINNQHLFRGINDYSHIKHILYKNTKMCNNFRISVALTILELFNCKKWLDISAGWGDRLIAAIGHNVDLYCGVDPNECLHPRYSEIINTLAAPQDHRKYILIKDGFETATLPNTVFDLVFSSPPFFDLEIYSKSAEDSLVRYSNVDAWYNKFLMVSLKKAAGYLEKGGHMVLYMGEGIRTDYIKNMIRELGQFMKYEGVIYYFYPNKNIPRPLYVWQKY